MASSESEQIRATLVNDRETLDVPLAAQRQEWLAAAAQVQLPPDITIAPVDIAGMPGEWVNSPVVAPQRVLFYLHGGGYNAGSCVTHRDLAARLCLASGVRVLLLDYRLAPEHPFPAAVHDTVAAYQWLLARGIPPEQIVMGGDSSGGGLALAAMLWLREHALAVPAAGVLLSPWVDLALTGSSIQSHAAIDPLVSPESLRLAASYYMGDADPKTPLASPVYADLRGLPPLLIQVGAHEVLLSDSTRLAEQARAVGMDVTIEVWDAMWHVWHAWAEVLPEGKQAIQRIGAFIRQQLARNQLA
ncbi:MAG TPA: alpha/beta hydrolase [Roseiflexaceae bacterium]